MSYLTAPLTVALLYIGTLAHHAAPPAGSAARVAAAAPAEAGSRREPPTAPKQQDTVTVEAKGVGRDRKDAVDQALKAAVMSAVGGVVDAETVAENDQVIKDRIRQLSGGIVQKYDVIDEKSEADSYMVVVRATISRKPIIDAFGDIIEGKAKVGGRNLIAKRKAMKRAGEDLKEAIIPAARELVAAPFAVSLSDEAFSNILGYQSPDDMEGLVTPLVLSIDTERWNRLASGLIERLKAFSPAIEETSFHVRSWQLTDKATADRVRAISEQIAGGANAQEVLKDTGGARIWLTRLAAEASSPVITSPGSDDRRMLNCFHVCGFHEVKPDTGIDSVSVTDTFTRSPKPAVLGVVSGLSGKSATITYFRLGEPMVASIVNALPLTTALEVELLGKDGERIASASKVLTAVGRTDDRQPLVALGAKSFGGSSQEDVVILVPGCVSFKRVEGVFDMKSATVVPQRVGGTGVIDTAWFGAIQFDFSEEEIDATEEIKVRCVPFAPRAEPN